VTRRLKDKGFRIYENVVYKNLVFEYVAKRTKFELEKFGFITTLFLFAKFTNPDVHLLSDFSAKSFNYAKKASGIHPPRGLCFGIVCFPVAIADSIDNDAAEAIRKGVFPKHWAAFEKLVVFSLELKTLYYSETTPMWGAMYHDRDRQTINEMLAP
jgi:hypothetical protein